MKRLSTQLSGLRRGFEMTSKLIFHLIQIYSKHDSGGICKEYVKIMVSLRLKKDIDYLPLLSYTKVRQKSKCKENGSDDISNAH